MIAINSASRIEWGNLLKNRIALKGVITFFQLVNEFGYYFNWITTDGIYLEIIEASCEPYKIDISLT